jgi:hypothetical protein
MSAYAVLWRKRHKVPVNGLSGVWTVSALAIYIVNDNVFVEVERYDG